MRHSASVDAVSPVRFDHRFLRKVLDLAGFTGPVSKSEYERLSGAFTRVGGSWQAIAKGSPQDIHKLKTLVKLAIKHGVIGKKD